ncbi:hypothetical protein HET69_32035 [Streptomyces sp. CJ_13]|nr:hypothetical protein [Streptomyces sp. CJ_13]
MASADPAVVDRQDAFCRSAVRVLPESRCRSCVIPWSRHPNFRSCSVISASTVDAAPSREISSSR